MRILARVVIGLALAAFAMPAWGAPPNYPTNITGVIAPGSVNMQCDASAANCAPVSAANPAPVSAVGGVAAGATDSGNPVKVGGVFNSTLPTLSSGQRGDMQLTSRGLLGVALYSGSTNTVITGINPANGTTNPSTAMAAASFGMLYNGGTWDTQKKPNSVSRLLAAAATTNGTSAKAAGGDLFQIVGYNAAASARYLKIYNKASAPTVGTDTPVLTLYLPASAPFTFSWPTPYYLSTGIAYAITGAAADADTTALTAGDVVALNLIYQ